MKKMDKPQCLIYSAAMVLGHNVEDLIEHLGHDGMEVWWPEFDDHRQYRSVSMQEIIDVFLQHDVALVPIQAMPLQVADGEHRDPRLTYEEPGARFMKHIRSRRAILIGQTEQGNGHAWAWDGKEAYDPRGWMCDIGMLSLREAWVMHNIKSNK